MYKKLIDKFFKENKTASDIPTAPALAHFQIVLELNPETNEKIHSLMNDTVFEHQPEREDAVMAERKEILAAKTADEIIRFMRKHTDPINQQVLVDKAIEFESEILPTILRMLKTSLNSGFIEDSIRILAKCAKNTADDLIACFDEIRNPYAQSMVLVALGFRAGEKDIPWVYDKYFTLKKLYPDESYHDGAYYALYEMEGRFYPLGKGKNI